MLCKNAAFFLEHAFSSPAFLSVCCWPLWIAPKGTEVTPVSIRARSGKGAWKPRVCVLSMRDHASTIQSYACFSATTSVFYRC